MSPESGSPNSPVAHAMIPMMSLASKNEISPNENSSKDPAAHIKYQPAAES
jgi:hypothetical protein